MFEVLESFWTLFITIINSIISIGKVVLDILKIKKMMYAELFCVPLVVITIVSILYSSVKFLKKFFI